MPDESRSQPIGMLGSEPKPPTAPVWAILFRFAGVLVRFSTGAGEVLLEVWWSHQHSFRKGGVAVTVTMSHHAGQQDSATATEVVSAELEQAQLEAANLRAALESNRTIGMAIGLSMERWSLSADAAFAVLRRHSQDSNTKLRDIAADLVATGQLPAPKAPGGVATTPWLVLTPTVVGVDSIARPR